MTELIAAGVAALVTFLITWGATRSKVYDLEKRTAKLESQTESQQTFIVKTREHFANQVNGLREIYVGYHHFDEAMAAMRESYKDLKEDVKKVLELLSSAR